MCLSHNSGRYHGELSILSAQLSEIARIKLRMSLTFRRTDVLVLFSRFGLRTRSPEGLLQPLGLLQACREGPAAHGAILSIGAPSRSGDISSHNALDGKHFETFDHHASALELGYHFRGQAFLESLRYIQGNVVSAKRWDLRLQQIEPELAELGKNGALLVDTLVTPRDTQLFHDTAV